MRNKKTLQIVPITQKEIPSMLCPDQYLDSISKIFRMYAPIGM